MVREYGIYQQGAMFTREDFDPYKTIKYLFDSYEIELSERLAQDIRNNKVSDEDFDYICKELEITPDERTLQSIVIHALNPVILHDIVVDDSEETHFQNDSVYASYHTDIVGEFLFDDEDKPHKDIEDECLMVCFYVPCVWDMKDADIPADKYMASLRIKEAVKGFLKDDINWEEIEKIMNKEFGEGAFWSFALDDISEVMENDHIVVLVEVVNIVMKDSSAEQEKLYRWFELPFDCSKEELLEKINNL